jgi:hypothetical protein
MTEAEVAEKIMAAFPRMKELRQARDEFSPFDYESDDYLVEIKSRRKAYDPWIIEQLKVDTNVAIAESVKKDFIYVNAFELLLFIWNISKLIREDYDFGFEDREMPWTTDFEAVQIISKRTGYLYSKDAIIVNTEEL